MKKILSMTMGILVLLVAVSFALGETNPTKECNDAAKLAKANCRSSYEEGSDSFVCCIHKINIAQGLCKESFTDEDGDGIPDGLDNCPSAYNPDQVDSNKNGIGDACESIWDVNSCTVYGNFTCADYIAPNYFYYTAKSYCYFSDSMAYETSNCPNGYACPQSQSYFPNDYACTSQGGELKSDSRCLSGTICGSSEDVPPTCG